ncbi:MAG: D,D-heptose 1,7-bisphosphate phosphatase [Candidatus Kuenenia stuttgartiensis]|nr:MAG: D,D-heptose 1,7-bisphosphate phosphatase [Candidatus Kuenenia stuttgartiensis]
MKKNKAAFLDRDGTIVVHTPYLSSPEQLKLLPHAVEGIRLFKDHDYLIIVVTNQSGVARGYFDEESLIQIHEKLKKILIREKAEVDAFYYCPHHAEGVVEQYRVHCDCRKPQPKMLFDAAQQYNIDLSQSIMIGDSPVDILAGKEAGCKSALIINPNHEQEADPDAPFGADYVVKDLLEAARLFIPE